MNHFIPYAKQSIIEEDIKAVSAALGGSCITRGPLVDAFEKEIAQYCGAQYCTLFSSGTAALSAAYHAVRTSEQDTLLSTPNTFVSSIGGGLQAGATLHLADIDLDNGNLSLDSLQDILKKHSGEGKWIVVPVHFAGIALDMQRLHDLLKPFNAEVIEDAAHALGSCYADGSRVGSCKWSALTVFSFHPAKTITTGEGGAVTTNDPELYQALKAFRNNGIERPNDLDAEAPYPGYYQVGNLTGNYNVTEMQAALGLSQLKRLDAFVKKRRELVKLYRELLGPYEDVIKPFSAKYDELSAYHLFVVQMDFTSLNNSRKAIMLELKKRGVGTQVHYIPLYKHSAVKCVLGSDVFPRMERYYNNALTLPLYYDLEAKDVEYCCAQLIDALHFIPRHR